MMKQSGLRRDGISSQWVSLVVDDRPGLTQKEQPFHITGEDQGAAEEWPHLPTCVASQDMAL